MKFWAKVANMGEKGPGLILEEGTPQIWKFDGDVPLGAQLGHFRMTKIRQGFRTLDQQAPS